MAKTKLTPATLLKVCTAVLKMSPREQRRVCKAIDAALDELADQDAFGTEKQLDPRGDPRG